MKNDHSTDWDFVSSTRNNSLSRTLILKCTLSNCLVIVSCDVSGADPYHLILGTGGGGGIYIMTISVAHTPSVDSRQGGLGIHTIFERSSHIYNLIGDIFTKYEHLYHK